MNTTESRLKLTVIIRDEGPLVHMNEPVALRSVDIDLTTEQLQQLEMRHTHTVAGVRHYESVSHCFLQEKP